MSQESIGYDSSDSLSAFCRISNIHHAKPPSTIRASMSSSNCARSLSFFDSRTVIMDLIDYFGLFGLMYDRVSLLPLIWGLLGCYQQNSESMKAV